MANTYLRKYGVQTIVNFELFEIDGVDLKIDAADGGTDCTIRKDQGADATCTNDFVDEGLGYSLTLSATEMQAAEITVYIVDTATKAYLDTVLKIETYGNASAQHAFDLDTANVTLASATHTGAVIPTVTDLTNLPSIPANWITTAGITNGAYTAAKFAVSSLDGKGDWNTVVPDAAGVAATEAEVVAAIASYDGPTNTEMTTAFTEIKGATWSSATDTLEAIRNKQTDIETDTNDLQTNQGNWLTVTGHATEAKQDTAQTDLDTISNGIIEGTAATGTLSTTSCTSSLTGYTDDQLIGRIITFLAGPADGESSDITDYASLNGQITFTALTLAPENGNAFKIT